MEKRIRKAISLKKVNYQKVKAFDKDKYALYLINKQVRMANKQPPEIAVQIVKALLRQGPVSKDAVIKSMAFDAFVKKFGDFVLSDKYDKIEALSDYALDEYNPKLKRDGDYYSKGKYYKVKRWR